MVHYVIVQKLTSEDVRKGHTWWNNVNRDKYFNLLEVQLRILNIYSLEFIFTLLQEVATVKKG